MATSYDAIIVGGGHNGLTCGAYLARAGLRTLVLERRHLVGGAAVTEELVPGFRFSVFSYVMSLLHPRIITELELGRFGLEVLPANDLFCPLGGDDYLVFSDDPARTQREFARFSRRDAEAYPRYCAEIERAASVVRGLLFEVPPDPSRGDWRAFKESAALLWRYRRAARELYRLIDLFTQSADDFLSRWFESDVVKAVLAYYASIGTFAGPRTPGSAYVILHHVMGEHEGAGGWGFVRGGMGTVSEAIATSGRRHGMEIETEAEVARIEVAGGRVARVVTADGREYRAPIVAASVCAPRLFGGLIGAEQLPAELLEDVARFRTFSTAFKINIAAESAPAYRAFDPTRCGFAYPSYVHLGPDIDYLEQAYLEARAGRYSRRPFITPVVPSIVDETVAPAGKHVVHLFGGHAPYRLRDGDWESERDGFVKAALAVVDEAAPGFSDSIIDLQVLLPGDIEAILDVPHGHIFHGEITPDQLFLKRPVPHYADYRSPIHGLYQCGSSSHPGGGVSGIPGYNAARVILADRRR